MATTSVEGYRAEGHARSLQSGEQRIAHGLNRGELAGRVRKVVV